MCGTLFLNVAAICSWSLEDGVGELRAGIAECFPSGSSRSSPAGSGVALARDVRKAQGSGATVFLGAYSR